MALTQAGTGPKSPPALTRVVQREKGVSHASVLTSIFSLSPYHPPHCTQFSSLLRPALRSETLHDNNSRSDGKVLPPRGIYILNRGILERQLQRGPFNGALPGSGWGSLLRSRRCHNALAPDHNQLSTAFQSRVNQGRPGHCPWLLLRS